MHLIDILGSQGTASFIIRVVPIPTEHDLLQMVGGWRRCSARIDEGCPKSSGPHAIQVLKTYYIYKMTSEPFNIIPLQCDALFPARGKLLDAVQKRLFIHSSDLLGQSGYQLLSVPKTSPAHRFF